VLGLYDKSSLLLVKLCYSLISKVHYERKTTFLSLSCAEIRRCKVGARFTRSGLSARLTPYTRLCVCVGVCNKKLRRYEDALEVFNKLHNILRNSAQVMYQLADLYPLLSHTHTHTQVDKTPTGPLALTHTQTHTHTHTHTGGQNT